MSQMIYLNGKIVPMQEATISVFDRGFLYGDGVFDTMRSYRGKLFRFADHWERLQTNTEALRIKLPFTQDEALQAITGVLEANELKDAYIRLTVSRGEGPIGIDYRACPRPTIVIMAQALNLNQDNYNLGWKVITLKTRRNCPETVNPQLKSMNFLNNIVGKMELVDAGFPEGIFLSTKGWVAEGTVSNLFFVKGNTLLTPDVEVGILPGVTRKVVLELAEELGIIKREGFFTLQDLYDADEVFLTGSVNEIVPVVEVDGITISDGFPGKITKHLHKAYQETVKKSQ